MCRRHAQGTACGQLFVGVGHHETAGVELAGGFLDETLVAGVIAIAGHIHAKNIGLGFAMDDPFCQAFAHATALQKARHHRAGAPIARLATHGAHQRVAIGGKCKGAIDPCFHAHMLQRGVALKAQGQFALDAVGIFLLQLKAIFPGGAIHHPMVVVDFVNAQQNAFLVLAHIGEALEIDDQRQFVVKGGHLGDCV